MQKFRLILTLVAVAFAVPSVAQVTITGKIDFPEPVQKVFLQYRSADGEVVKDSAELVKGNFLFSEKITEPTLANLQIRFNASNPDGRPKMQAMQLFLEPGKINIEAKDTLGTAKVTGSKAHTALIAYNELQKPYNEKFQEINKQYAEFSKNKDEAGMESIREKYKNITEEKNEKVLRKYVTDNPGSPIALYVVRQYAGFDMDVPKTESLFLSLPAAARNTAQGKSFAAQIAIAKKTMVGAMAMDFTQNDTLGKPVSLSSFKGQYVLVDFWASWCGPCRAENPNVVKAFHAYKDKRFTVLGVSLDQPGKQKAWIDAIHKDGLAWTNVSDLNYFDNAVAKQYGIIAIPQNFLLDKSGKIIAKNIRGEELNKKLNEVIN